jgi:hypothetical protein
VSAFDEGLGQVGEARPAAGGIPIVKIGDQHGCAGGHNVQARSLTQGYPQLGLLLAHLIWSRVPGPHGERQALHSRRLYVAFR